MTKIKTAELQGAALDWAVAKCEGWTVSVEEFMRPQASSSKFAYSTVWAKGGPLVEREGIDVMKVGVKQWRADCGPARYGLTPLIAAMRCFVSSRLGDEVDVPDDLI